MLRDDPVAGDPRRERDVDERELLPEEVRALHLRAERPERAAELREEPALLLGVLLLDEAHVRDDDLLVDVVRPEADERAVERVGREEARLGLGERVFEELADDEGLVERAAFVLDRGDEALWVDRCNSTACETGEMGAEDDGETDLGSGIPSCRGSPPCIGRGCLAPRGRSKRAGRTGRTVHAESRQSRVGRGLWEVWRTHPS